MVMVLFARAMIVAANMNQSSWTRISNWKIPKNSKDWPIVCHEWWICDCKIERSWSLRPRSSTESQHQVREGDGWLGQHSLALATQLYPEQLAVSTWWNMHNACVRCQEGKSASPGGGNSVEHEHCKENIIYFNREDLWTARSACTWESIRFSPCRL